MIEPRRLPLLLLLPVLLLAACATRSTATPLPDPDPQTTPSPALTPVPGTSDDAGGGGDLSGDIAAAHEAWVAGGIRSYTWQVLVRCFCPERGPLTVTVEDGVVTGITADTGPVPGGELPGFDLTVDGVYAQIADALAQGGKVTGTFDAAGVPRKIWLDPIANVADDEYSLEIVSFSPAS